MISEHNESLVSNDGASPRIRRTFGAASLVALAAAAPAILAPSSAVAQSSDEVVVTGTRISGFNAPTPVTQVTAQELQEKAISTVADLLDDIPQLRINQNIGKSSEPVGAANADLRGLGTNRTLVLFDGRRVAITDPAGTIDTNVIPVSIIKSVEVVTGGASAAYGSDAVGGVVNFVLDKKFTGFKADASYGETKYRDFSRPTANFAWGGEFNKLHVLVAGDYMHNSGQTSQGKRKWGRNETVQLGNPTFTRTNGQAALLVLDNGRFSAMTDGGVMANRAVALSLATRLGFGAAQGVQFGPGGAPQPFNYGANFTQGGLYMTGGDGGSVEDAGNLLPEIGRGSAFLRADFEVNDKLRVYADYLFSGARVTSDLTPNPSTGGATPAPGDLLIRNDNAFLNQSVKNAMAAASVTSFTFGRMNTEEGNSVFKNKTNVQRVSVGFEGDISESWRWDASATIGRNHYRSDSYKNRLQQRWLNGIDSILVGGVPTCRIKTTGTAFTDANDPFRDARDCVPINPFGAGSITADMQKYYIGTSFLDAKIEQDVYAVNFNGEPFQTPGGPVSVAFGAEHRREQTVQTSDANSATFRRWRSINAQPFTGKFDVDEAYGEFVAPLAGNSSWVDHFDVNGAFRYTDYSTSGAVRTWKLGLNYAPVKQLRFRGVISRDIRAPNNADLFNQGNQVISGIRNPWLTGNPSINTTQVTKGNPLLDPEEARTHSIGVVYQGDAGVLKGFRASIDYYEINISKAIAVFAPQAIVDNCFAGQLDFCTGVVRDSGNNISQLNIQPFNAQSQKTSGLDMEAAYRFDNVAGGDFTVRVLSTFVRELATTASGVSTDYVGHVGLAGPPAGVPEWRGNVDLNWHRDALRLGLGYQYIGGGVIDVTKNLTQIDYADNSIAGRSYFNVNASYDLTQNYQVYGRVENLLNVDPPITPNGITQPNVSQSPFYDKRGLFMVVGGRVKF